MKTLVGWPRPPRSIVAILLGLAIALLQAPSASAFGFLDQWGGTGTAQGSFMGPEGLGVGPTGTVYVGECGGGNRVQQFTSIGTFIREWGSGGTAAGQFNCVGGLAVNPANGDVYVTDTSNNRVQQFTSSGTFIRKWGKGGGDGTSGALDGEFDGPIGIVVGNGSVYVSECGGKRVQQFGLTGTFVRKWGTAGEFVCAGDMTVAPSGDLYVIDGSGDRVRQYTSSGGFIRQWGSSGTGSGDFDSPGGIAVDAAGHVWVLDNARLQEFTSTGLFIRKLGKNGGDGTVGSGPGEFNGAYEIAVDCRGNLYAADFGNDRVEKFGETGAGEPPCPPAKPKPKSPPLLDRTKPGVRLRYRKRQRLGKLTVFVRANENATVLGTGSLNLSKTARSVRFKRARRSARANVRIKLRFKLSRRGRKAARRAFHHHTRLRVRLKLKVTDAAGNSTSKTIKVKVKSG